MDNASKALIMAGAILLAVAIVGIGMAVFNSTSDVSRRGQQTLSEAEMQTRHAEIVKYNNSQITGTELKRYITLLDQTKDEQSFGNKFDYVAPAISTINDSTKYWVACHIDDAGYVDKVGIDNNKAQSRTNAGFNLERLEGTLRALPNLFSFIIILKTPT